MHLFLKLEYGCADKRSPTLTAGGITDHTGTILSPPCACSVGVSRPFRSSCVTINSATVFQHSSYGTSLSLQCEGLPLAVCWGGGGVRLGCDTYPISSYVCPLEDGSFMALNTALATSITCVCVCVCACVYMTTYKQYYVNTVQ